MNNSDSNGFQAFGPPLQGYSDPNSSNYSSNNLINSSVLIPGTHVPNVQPNDVYQRYAPPSRVGGRPLINSSVLMYIPGTYIPYGNPNDVYQLYAPPGIQPMLYRVITGGNDGPLYVPTTNPSFAYNSKNLFGHICTSCGKGILLMDMEMARNGYGIILCYLTLVCPFLCFYFRYCKNRKCTSCKGEFPNTWC